SKVDRVRGLDENRQLLQIRARILRGLEQATERRCHRGVDPFRRDLDLTRGLESIVAMDLDVEDQRALSDRLDALAVARVAGGRLLALGFFPAADSPPGRTIDVEPVRRGSATEREAGGDDETESRAPGDRLGDSIGVDVDGSMRRRHHDARLPGL